MKLALTELLQNYKGTNILAPIPVGVQSKRNFAIHRCDCHCGSDDCAYDCDCMGPSNY